MPGISLTQIKKAYGVGAIAVHGLDLTIPDGAFMCLLGPSGCGKTTTLRMIAGLEQPTAGEIRVGDRVLDSVQEGKFVPTEKRGMGFVFQSYALWPHLTVRRNVDFGLRLRKVSHAERDRRADDAMERLQIRQLADRYPAQLSGGQQQRVSLARMLAVSPSVLLLDEPLSNLDAQLRLQMRAELKSLHESTNRTIVYVTHDQLEAMTMATHVAVMSNGYLQQAGPPLDVYHRPANLFVAGFLGSPAMNLVVADGQSDRTPIGGGLRQAVERACPEIIGEVETIGVRPEAICVARDRSSVPADAALFEVEVRTVLPTGSSWVVSLPPEARLNEAARHGDDDALGDVYAVTFSDPGVKAGDRIVGWVPLKELHVFDRSGDRLAAWDAAMDRNDEAVSVAVAP